MDSTHPNFKHKVPRRVSSRGGPPLLFGQNNNPPNQNFHGDNEGQGPAPANADPVWVVGSNKSTARCKQSGSPGS